MAKKQILLWLILSSLVTTSVGAAPRIRSISFEGNEITQRSLLMREMYLREGDELDLEKLEQSVQAIMDLGLFRDVSYYLAEDYMGPDAPRNVIDVVILMEEKYYLFVLPRARVDEEELHLGVQLNWDNIAGLNHSLNFLVEDRGTTSGVAERRQRFTYDYPNVNGSRYALSFRLLNINTVDLNEIDAIINRKDALFGMDVSKWLNPTGRNRGWYIGVGFDNQTRENETVSGALQDEKLDARTLKLRYGFKSVHEYSYNRGGKEYGYSLDFANDFVGSDIEFLKHILFYRSYYRFESRPDDNVNVQVLLGHATEDILGDAAFQLGSSQGLRGYDNSEFEGNTLILLNMEYLRPEPSFKPLRYVYFLDLGNTYDDIHDVRRDGLKIGLGVGVRWKIPQFVKLDLRMDIGYGTSDDSHYISFGTRHVF